MKLKNLKEEKGFTIIEVLIVLAIAGLIMVVVFLAVPALQRNSRNTQRTNDVSRIASAISECATNNNGNTSACATQAALANYYDFGSSQQITALGSASLNSAAIAANTQCNSAGSGTVTGGGTRAYTLSYLVETSGGTAPRCVNV